MAAPLPEFDHFSALSEEIGKDVRLTVAERALLARAARRMRRDFWGCSELTAIHACMALRADVEVMAARAGKRLEAIEVFNGTIDKMNRAFHRFGKARPRPQAPRGKSSVLWQAASRKKAPEVEDEDERAGDSPAEDAAEGEAAGGES